MRYPFDMTPDGPFLFVTFPDVPEAITQGETEQEAIAMAADVLETAFDFYTEDGRPIPPPSTPRQGQHSVELSPEIVHLVQATWLEAKEPHERLAA